MPVLDFNKLESNHSKTDPEQFNFPTYEDSSSITNTERSAPAFSDRESPLLSPKDERPLCDFADCAKDKKSWGQCSKSFCWGSLQVGGCGRNFCRDHDGRYLIDSSQFRGLVCIECAPKIEQKKRQVNWGLLVLTLIVSVVLFICIVVYA